MKKGGSKKMRNLFGAVWYVVFLGFIFWQIESKGPLAYMLKGFLELILGQELTWN